jgi:hypothetical protein
MGQLLHGTKQESYAIPLAVLSWAYAGRTRDATPRRVPMRGKQVASASLIVLIRAKVEAKALVVFARYATFPAARAARSTLSRFTTTVRTRERTTITTRIDRVVIVGHAAQKTYPP